MKKQFTLITGFMLTIGFLFGQASPNTLSFEKGQIYEFSSAINSGFQQDAMGRKMEVLVKGMIYHSYEVISISTDSVNFSHKTNRITVSLDGMNQKMNFDSDIKKDLDSDIGKSMKNALQDTYNMTIDMKGNVTDVQTTVTKGKKSDPSELDMFKNLLTGFTSSLEAPKKGDASVFKILPENEISKGFVWVEKNDKEKKKVTYAVSDITDSEVLISYKSEYTTESKGNIMGMDTFTNLDNSENGKIVLNKSTGIIKSKNTTTTASGNVSVMGQSIPIVSAANAETKVSLK
jgi:uncharacterized protein Veg